MKLIIDKYRCGKYEEVISMGKKYRETLNGKGIPALDYMILTSICMNPSKKEKACKISALILDDYYKGISRNDIALMKEGFSSICNSNSILNNDLIAKIKNSQYIDRRKPGGVFAEFKSYHIIHGGFLNKPNFNKITISAVEKTAEESTFKNDSISNLSNEIVDNLVSKRCKKNDALGIKRAINRYGVGTKYFVTQNFLIISAKKNPINLSKVGENMQKVLEFYNTNYAFESSDELVVINLATKLPDLKAIINKMYGIVIDFDILGYSNRFDNCITAWIADANSVGSIKHELIHLLLKSKFSSTPHWFEEGLAELYEESQFNDKVLIGRNNWRLSILQANLFNYSILDLINNSEFEPTPTETNLMKQKAINYIKKWNPSIYQNESTHIDMVLDDFFKNYFNLYRDALSRYFILYLQDTGKLKPLFNNLLKRDVELFDLDNYETIETVIEKSCDKTAMKDVESEFEAWLTKQHLEN